MNSVISFLIQVCAVAGGILLARYLIIAGWVN